MIKLNNNLYKLYSYFIIYININSIHLIINFFKEKQNLISIYIKTNI